MPKKTIAEVEMEKPRVLSQGGSIRLGMYIFDEDWEILKRIKRVVSPGANPGISALVRIAIQEAGKSKRFQAKEDGR